MANDQERPLLETRYVDDVELGNDLDEIIARDCTVHLERMDNNWYWIGIDTPDGKTHMFHLGAKRATVKATHVE